MMTTDTSERGLERRICTILTGLPCEPTKPLQERPATYGTGWICGKPSDYDRDYCVDLAQLTAFLENHQPKVARELDLHNDSPTRRQFLSRLKEEITQRGIINILRTEIRHGAHAINLFHIMPSHNDMQEKQKNTKNIFSVTRQLAYSSVDQSKALDLGLFINGLPIFTFELKNNLTKQTYSDAIEQYKRNRNPQEDLFKFGRCVAHFAVDENQVHFCTELKGKNSWFLPFNKGYKNEAGNPLNENGLRTDYLWEEILTPDSLTNILKKYAQIVSEGTQRKQIFPRYHQLDVVRKLLDDVAQQGIGKRYLIQHSAGSGKSNSIAWLAYQLVELKKDDKIVFDSIIVVTDRKVLDNQIHNTIKQLLQVRSILGHADSASNLKKLIESDKKIIISTVQKFPHLLDVIGSNRSKRNYAIIIDEAHSSQGGRASQAMATALGENETCDEEDTYEDQINRIMESRQMLSNASYFAFTATPKSKTLEMFGTPQPGNTGKRLPFHSYTMKQAIQEGFILDVLQHYTPIGSYYQIIKTVEDDPKFDTKKAQKKLRRYVEGHEKTIRIKSEIIVDHFLNKVSGAKLVGGEARAMVVTDGVKKAIQYFHAIKGYLKKNNSHCKAIVAFSGEHQHGGASVTEAYLNGFPSNRIKEKIREHPYYILVCADKFQTGYDEPLLQTMYVDKTLFGIKAVQTLSRLNRKHPKKDKVFILDFINDIETIQEAFNDYYQTTILASETDPNRLHNLKTTLDEYQIYSPEQVTELVSKFLSGDSREQLDPILDSCVRNYKEDLDQDDQIRFKREAKMFLRTYDFLASILPFTYQKWEELSIFLNFLILKLPSPKEDDLSKGILETIDIDSYRAQIQATQKISLKDEDSEIEPPPIEPHEPSTPEIKRLSDIIKEFNQLHFDLAWDSDDKDRAEKIITHEIPDKVSRSQQYQNAKDHSDPQNARIECDNAIESVMGELMSDNVSLYKNFVENPDFADWLKKSIFELTYTQKSTP